MSDLNAIFGAPIEIQQQSVAPANPPAGTNLVYPKTDGCWYTLDSNGNEEFIGSAGSNQVLIRTFFR